MLVKSKLSSAPSSDRSSSAFSRASRSARSRFRSTRFSQSTAFWPKVWAIRICTILGQRPEGSRGSRRVISVLTVMNINCQESLNSLGDV